MKRKVKEKMSNLNEVVAGLIYEEYHRELVEKRASPEELKEIINLGERIHPQKVRAAKNLIAEKNEKDFRESIYKNRLYEKYSHYFRCHDAEDLKRKKWDVYKDYSNDRSLENEMKLNALIGILKEQNLFDY